MTLACLSSIKRRRAPHELRDHRRRQCLDRRLGGGHRATRRRHAFHSLARKSRFRRRQQSRGRAGARRLHSPPQSRHRRVGRRHLQARRLRQAHARSAAVGRPHAVRRRQPQRHELFPPTDAVESVLPRRLVCRHFSGEPASSTPEPMVAGTVERARGRHRHRLLPAHSDSPLAQDRRLRPGLLHVWRGRPSVVHGAPARRPAARDAGGHHHPPRRRLGGDAGGQDREGTQGQGDADPPAFLQAARAAGARAQCAWPLSRAIAFTAATVSS